MIMGFRANILDCYTEGTYRVYIQKSILGAINEYTNDG